MIPRIKIPCLCEIKYAYKRTIMKKEVWFCCRCASEIPERRVDVHLKEFVPDDILRNYPKPRFAKVGDTDHVLVFWRTGAITLATTDLKPTDF